MYLTSPCLGLEQTFCVKCIDQEAPDRTDVHIACSVRGCGSAPGFVLEDRFIERRTFALCEHHFMTYEGIIDLVLRLPEQSVCHDAVVGGASVDSWHPSTDDSDEPVQEPAGVEGNDGDQ